jgi:uncharacterized protein (DUF58 family)
LKRRALVTTLVAVALLLIAATIKSGWLYLVASVLFSLVVAGALSGRLANRCLEISRECQAEVFEGEPFRVKLSIGNSGRLTRYFLLITDMAFERPARKRFAESVREHRAEMRELAATGAPPHNGPGGGKGREHSRTVAVERVAPGTAVEVAYEMIAPRRGIYGEADVKVSSGGVFGAAESSRTFRVEAPLVVYPGVSLLAYFPFEPRGMAAPLDSFECSRKGIGQDYYGVREYVGGDSLKHIHWRSSARQGELIVREYQQEFRPFAGLVVLLGEPVHGDADSNSLEDGLRCAASILNYYEAMGSKPRLVVPRDGDFEVLRDATLYGGLEALAAYTPYQWPESAVGGNSLEEAMSYVRSALVPGSSVAVVTNAPGDSLAAVMEVVPDVEGATLVVVFDRSYAGGWDTGDSLLEVARLEKVASRRVNLFVMTRGQEIGACLSEPLSITAS